MRTASVILWILTGVLLVSSWAWAFHGQQAQAEECFGVAMACAGMALMTD